MDTQDGWHGTVEYYTPDDTTRRALVAMPLIAIGGYSLTWFAATLVSTIMLWVPLIGAGVSLGILILGLVMVWPLYLSFIGNIDSPEAYMRTEPEAGSESALGTAKQQYAAGDISEQEFERRVENLLNTDSKVFSKSGTTTTEQREHIRERE